MLQTIMQIGITFGLYTCIFHSIFETSKSDTKMDPTGKYIITTRCRTGRSVRGFRLPPCCSFEERREIEKAIVNGLMKLDGDLAGEYFPLAG